MIFYCANLSRRGKFIALKTALWAYEIRHSIWSKQVNPAMEASDKPAVGHKGRFYLTKHIWLPQEPADGFNLRMSDMILRRMPKLQPGGEDALKAFPVLAELKNSHDKIRADLDYLLSHHKSIPALHEVHPRDLFVPGRAWRTFLLKIWGHEIKENTAAVPDTYEAICRIPGVHTALFSILQGGAEITPHRGSAAGVIRFHYPLIVPEHPRKTAGSRSAATTSSGRKASRWCSTTRASTGSRTRPRKRASY